MPEIIHIGLVRQGQITVYSNGDYILVYGDDPNDIDATTEYFRSSFGPEDLELLVQRYVSIWESTHQIAEQRSSGSSQRLRHTSQEDQWAVPPHLRSNRSLARSDLRLYRGGASAAMERDRRARAMVARGLATRMARLHAYLEYLVSEHQQGNLQRFEPVVMSDSTTTPGRPPLLPSELHFAIEAGHLIDLGNGRLALADRSRALGNSILSRLGEELPGFKIQYNIVYERERLRITVRNLETAIMAIIDIVTELITLGVSGAITSLARMLRSGLGRLRAARNARTVPHSIPPRAVTADASSAASNSRGIGSNERGLTTDAHPRRTTRTNRELAERGSNPPPGSNEGSVGPSRGSLGEIWRLRPEGSIRGTRRLSDGEARVSDAFAREGHDVFNIPETPGDWQDLTRTRPGNTRGSEGQRGSLDGGAPGRDGASMTRAQREAYIEGIEEARRRDRLPTDSTTNPDHLIDGQIWDTKILERGSFNPTSVEGNIFSSVRRGQSRRIAIDVQNVIENDIQVPASTLIRRYRQWIQQNRSAAELRHGSFGANVNEVVFVQNGRIFRLYSR